MIPNTNYVNLKDSYLSYNIAQKIRAYLEDMFECGAPFLREAIAAYYGENGVRVSYDEVFVSSGASDERGDILDLFDRNSSALVIKPAYPAYVDANVMTGRKIVLRLSSP